MSHPAPDATRLGRSLVAVSRQAANEPGFAIRSRTPGRSCLRQGHMEGRAAAGCGVDGDLPAVGGGQRRRDGQPEPGTAASAGAGAVGAVEPLEPRDACSAVMPGAWSATVSCARPEASVTVTGTGDPGAVCWRALPIRLSMTCRSRSPSASTITGSAAASVIGRPGSTTRARVTPSVARPVRSATDRPSGRSRGRSRSSAAAVPPGWPRRPAAGRARPAPDRGQRGAQFVAGVRRETAHAFLGPQGARLAVRSRQVRGPMLSRPERTRIAVGPCLAPTRGRRAAGTTVR